MNRHTLVQQAKEGSEEAFFDLVAMHKERLYRIAVAYLKNEEDALEAIQETTYRAWKKLGKLKEADKFSAWLVRILLNSCNDEWKRRKRYAQAVDANVQAAQATPAAAGEAELVGRIHLSIALDRLEPKYKQILILKYYEDMTLTEIAELLDRPAGTVKTWLHKALMQIRMFISEDEEVRHEAGYGRAH